MKFESTKSAYVYEQDTLSQNMPTIFGTGVNFRFRGCETVQLVHYILSNIDGAIYHQYRQTDSIIIDFAKAFHNELLRRLLYKLDYYWIKGSTYNWLY